MRITITSDDCNNNEAGPLIIRQGQVRSCSTDWQMVRDWARTCLDHARRVPRCWNAADSSMIMFWCYKWHKTWHYLINTLPGTTLSRLNTRASDGNSDLRHPIPRPPRLPGSGTRQICIFMMRFVSFVSAEIQDMICMGWRYGSKLPQPF